MAEHSKVAEPAARGILQLIINNFTGTPQKKAFSGVLLAIIAYLIYIKNKKTATENIKLKDLPKPKVIKLLK